jgi:hypothetical protein
MPRVRLVRDFGPRLIHELTIRSGTWQETTVLVGKLNRALRGWANYFDVGSVSSADRVTRGIPVSRKFVLQDNSQFAMTDAGDCAIVRSDLLREVGVIEVINIEIAQQFIECAPRSVHQSKGKAVLKSKNRLTFQVPRQLPPNEMTKSTSRDMWLYAC